MYNMPLFTIEQDGRVTRIREDMLCPLSLLGVFEAEDVRLCVSLIHQNGNCHHLTFLSLNINKDLGAAQTVGSLKKQAGPEERLAPSSPHTLLYPYTFLFTES